MHTCVPKPAADAERAMSLWVAQTALSIQKRHEEEEECFGRYGEGWKGGSGKDTLLFYCICARNPSKQIEVTLKEVKGL